MHLVLYKYSIKPIETITKENSVICFYETYNPLQMFHSMWSQGFHKSNMVGGGGGGGEEIVG